MAVMELLHEAMWMDAAAVVRLPQAMTMLACEEHAAPAVAAAVNAEWWYPLPMFP